MSRFTLRLLEYGEKKKVTQETDIRILNRREKPKDDTKAPNPVVLMGVEVGEWAVAPDPRKGVVGFMVLYSDTIGIVKQACAFESAPGCISVNGSLSRRDATIGLAVQHTSIVSEIQKQLIVDVRVKSGTSVGQSTHGRPEVMMHANPMDLIGRDERLFINKTEYKVIARDLRQPVPADCRDIAFWGFALQAISEPKEE